jgi:hypothetical protein
MNRYSLLSFALALPFVAAACGGSDEEGESGPAEGEHYRYVVATVDPSETNKLDIDGNKSVENRLGGLVGLLNGFDLKVNETINEAVLSGAAVLLVDVQTSSFANASNAGVSFYLGDGATAMPAPCTDATMISTCGQHLMGNGSFSLTASSPRDTELRGPFTTGTLKTTSKGKISIQVALTGAPIVVNLVSARAQIGTITADGIGKGVVGGAITESELNSNIFPAVAAQIEAIVERDCGPLAGRDATGDCSCAANSTALTILQGPVPFDTATPKDCRVSVEEIKSNLLISSQLAPDVMVDGQPGLSVVIGFTAKKATFTP